MLELYDTKELPDGTIHIYFKLIECYQQEETFLTKKHVQNYHKGYFSRGRNTIALVTRKDKLVIPQLIQRYVVKWYHMHLLHPGIDRTEAIIRQHFYWPVIGKSVHMEVTICDTCQRKKW